MLIHSRDDLNRRIDEHTKIFEAALPEVPAMENEIERSFLIQKEDIPYDLDTLEKHAIKQVYVAIDGDTEVRVRLKDESAVMTIKKGTGLIRDEQEFSISDEVAAGILSIAGDRQVEKTRYIIDMSTYRIELDVFHGPLDGLILAEIEFVDEASSDAFTPPPWFSDEVTTDTRYMNRNLAVQGLPE